MEIKVSQTLATQTHRILPRDSNGYSNLYGGRLLDIIDNISSISAQRFAHANMMTASLDDMNFIHHLPQSDAVTVQSYVSGSGTRSIEVFVKVVGENLITGERYLAATAFGTFVVVGEADVKDLQIVADSEESEFILSGYEERRKVKLQKREQDKEMWSQLELGISE